MSCVTAWACFGGNYFSCVTLCMHLGCGFFAYSWKLPAYSGAFYLQLKNFSFSTYSWSIFVYSFSFLTYSWSFFAYNGKASNKRLKGL